MRLTRQQYEDSHPLRPRKVGFHEAVERVKREIKRKAIADGVILDPSTRPPRCKWAWEYGDRGGIIEADTRSQARNLIKSKLGLRKKDRLPVDIIIIQVGSSAP